MKTGMILVAVALSLTMAACSETGYYKYEPYYSYDPTDPDYRTTLNVVGENQYFDWYNWEYTDEPSHYTTYSNDSVIVFEYND